MTKSKCLPPNQISSQGGIPSCVETMDGKNKSSRQAILKEGGIPRSNNSTAGKYQMSNIKTKVLSFGPSISLRTNGEHCRTIGICALTLFWILSFGICHYSFAQQSEELVFDLDTTASTVALPRIFRPNIDLSGRGFSPDKSWPQQLAAPEVLEKWEKEIGFNGMYRLQYNLWEIEKLRDNKEAQDKLLSNYEQIMQRVTEAGGVVILNLFGTPAGLGRTLDVRSAPRDLPEFKQIIKDIIRHLSCEKRYNIWYEVWSAPDLEDFFLGRKQEYLILYKTIAEAKKELEAEAKIFIPLGGPSVSYWFQNFESNTILTPERSLIYELIKFCYRYRLPLDFITWHGYSSDPTIEREITTYNKNPATLIQSWLTYFSLNKDIPLIVDEWNYDSGLNILAERGEKSFVAASYIPQRIKNMHEQGINYQLYFSLEDFQNNTEGIARNVGAFWFDPAAAKYKGGAKAIYNVFQMLQDLGSEMFATPKLNDEFIHVIATKDKDTLILLISNYIDPNIFKNYLSRNIGTLRPGEIKQLLRLIKTGKIDEVIHKKLDIAGLRATRKVKALLKKAQEFNTEAERLKTENRKIKLNFKNLKGDYLYHRYTVDSTCSLDCVFVAMEEKELLASDAPAELLMLNPYSVQMIVLRPKPQEAGQEAVSP